MNKCPNCGTKYDSDDQFCKKCGAPISRELKGNTDETEILSFEDDTKPDNIDKYPSLNNNIDNTNSYQQPLFVEVIPATEETVVKDDSNSKEESTINDSNRIKITISLILGIISIVMLGLPIPSILGLIFALLTPFNTRNRNKVIVLNLIGLILGVIMTVVFITIAGSISDDSLDLPKDFVGNGYTLSYGKSWVAATLPPDNINVLKYSTSKSYLAEIDHSSYEDTIKCDISSTECQINVYNDFYDFWKEDIAQYLAFDKDIDFKKLKDDIYIAKYTYNMKSTGEAGGKYYLLISKSKNAVLSFVSRVDGMKIKYFDSEVMLLLNSIEIEKVKTKDEINNWKDYSYLRGDVIANNMKLSGEYRILADDESYWVFNDEEFWFFKSEDKRNDNYWYGKYKMQTGKKGLSSVGLTNEQIKTFTNKTKRNIDLEDVYSLILTPERIVSSGEDKSSTIPSGTEWKLIWLLINHKKEGIEAQVLNVDNFEYSYYYKVKD